MSSGTDCASNGVITVLMDHSKTASMSTVLQPKRLAVLAPMILKEKMTHCRYYISSVMARGVRGVYLTSEISEGERGQYPSLPVQVPLELVGHRHDGDGHDYPVRGVYEIRGRAEGHDARRARQHPEFRHCQNPLGTDLRPGLAIANGHRIAQVRRT